MRELKSKTLICRNRRVPSVRSFLYFVWMSLRDRAFLSRALRAPPLLLFRAGNIQDFADSSLGVENKGFQMLRGLGWEEGAGLGAKGAGRLSSITVLYTVARHTRCIV